MLAPIFDELRVADISVVLENTSDMLEPEVFIKSIEETALQLIEFVGSLTKDSLSHTTELNGSYHISGWIKQGLNPLKGY